MDKKKIKTYKKLSAPIIPKGAKLSDVLNYALIEYEGDKYD